MADRVNDGGPAFPVEREAAFMPVTDMYGRDISSGMSLRDYFAAAALPGVIEACKHDTLDVGESVSQMFARKAYVVADAMLKAREVQP